MCQYRGKELDQLLQDPKIDPRKKEERLRALRRGEAQYLRFLRTKERPENFSTLKVIGKGAFGEVKLVKKKADDNIYALKSLVKSEMVWMIDCLHSAWVTRLIKATVQKRPAGPRSIGA